MEKNNEVIFTGDMKGLPKNSIGVVDSIYGDMATIVYPQFSPKEKEDKYVYSNFVYAHSAKLSELISSS